MSADTPSQPPKSGTPPGDRIAKVLSRVGIASRREAERMIEAGRVRVNGAQIDSPALNVTPSDAITVDGKPVGEPEPPPRLAVPQAHGAGHHQPRRKGPRHDL